MGYIGSQPATNFETVRKQVSTTNSGTTITLDYSVSSVQDILVTVNAVVQSYDNYSVSGTTLTLGGTLNNDRVEILYVGRTFQTVTPDNNTVTNDMLVGSIANSKLANSSISINGSSVSLGGSASVDNTPAFFVSLSSAQSISSDTTTKVQFNSESFDTDNAYDNSTNYRFTAPSSGKYYFISNVDCHSLAVNNLEIANVFFYKNGSAVNEQSSDFRDNPIRRFCATNSIILDLSASDYVEVYGFIRDASGSPQFSGGTQITTYFGGYKLI